MATNERRKQNMKNKSKIRDTDVIMLYYSVHYDLNIINQRHPIEMNMFILSSICIIIIIIIHKMGYAFLNQQAHDDDDDVFTLLAP